MFSSQICANVSDGLTCYAATVGFLICTLISDLRNQGQFQNLEKFQMLQILIFFWVSTLKKSWLYTIHQKKNSVGHTEQFRFWKPGFFFRKKCQVPPSKLLFRIQIKRLSVSQVTLVQIQNYACERYSILKAAYPKALLQFFWWSILQGSQIASSFILTVISTTPFWQLQVEEERLWPQLRYNGLQIFQGGTQWNQKLDFVQKLWNI